MGLEEASRVALAAAAAGDWDEVGRALDARAEALGAGEPATEEALRLGEELRIALRAWRLQLESDVGRLRQIEGSFGTMVVEPDIDVVG